MPQKASSKHLSTEERQRVRTLYFDARMSRAQIQEATGYSKYQIRNTLRSEDAKVKPRSGRPKKLSEE